MRTDINNLDLICLLRYEPEITSLKNKSQRMNVRRCCDEENDVQKSWSTYSFSSPFEDLFTHSYLLCAHELLLLQQERNTFSLSLSMSEKRKVKRPSCLRYSRCKSSIEYLSLGELSMLLGFQEETINWLVKIYHHVRNDKTSRSR